MNLFVSGTSQHRVPIFSITEMVVMRTQYNSGCGAIIDIAYYIMTRPFFVSYIGFKFYIQGALRISQVFLLSFGRNIEYRNRSRFNPVFAVKAEIIGYGGTIIYNQGSRSFFGRFVRFCFYRFCKIEMRIILVFLQ